MATTWQCGPCGTVNKDSGQACLACGSPRHVDGGAEPIVPVVPVVPGPASAASPSHPAGFTLGAVVPGQEGTVAPGQEGVPVSGQGAAVAPSSRRGRGVWMLSVALMVLALVVVAVAFAVSTQSTGDGAADDGVALGGGVADRDSNDDANNELSRDKAEATTTTSAPMITEAPSPTIAPAAAPVTEIHPGELRARASTVLPPNGSLTYGPGNLLDGNLNTAWSQWGTADGGVAAVGSWVAFDLPTRYDVTQVAIVNGYVKNAEVYDKNARVKGLRVEADTGVTASVTLTDTPEQQYLALDFPGATSVRMTIESTYPGSAHIDVGITEVRLSGRPAG